MSVFRFIDSIADVKPNESLTAFFTLKGDEEFLLDHFEGFAVMPGVLMLEALKQAGAALLGGDDRPYRLESATDVKFGQFVRPGNRLKLSVRYLGRQGQSEAFDGRIDVLDAAGTRLGRALSAAMTLRQLGAN